MYVARELAVVGSERSRVWGRGGNVPAHTRTFAARLDAVAGCPRQARGSRLRAHNIQWCIIAPSRDHHCDGSGWNLTQELKMWHSVQNPVLAILKRF
jgi:hypothetical protein